MQTRCERDILGADVSHWQGTIDWPVLTQAGIRYVFIKATEGLTYRDPMLKQNAAGAAAAGIPTGYYHFAHPERNRAESEATAFVNAVRGLPCKLPLVLDIEGQDAAAIDRATLTRWCDTFLQEVQQLTGCQVMIYTGASFARDHLGPQLGKYPLWVAHYGVETPLQNATWERWAVFQYTDTGTMPGVQSRGLDLNAMCADFFDSITGEDEAAMEELRRQIAELKAKLTEQEAPDWAKESVQKAQAAGIINTPTGTEDFFRLCVMLDRAGVLGGNQAPDWATTAVQKAQDAGLISDPTGTIDFFRLCVILDKAGIPDAVIAAREKNKGGQE